MSEVSFAVSLVCCATLLLSCSSSGSNNPFDNLAIENQEGVKIEQQYTQVPYTTELDSNIVFVYFSDSISFHWNNHTSKIEEDAHLQTALSNFDDQKWSLVAQISDSTRTSAQVCTDDNNLCIGDLAFALIDRVVRLPYAQLLQRQFCILEGGCPFPIGLFGAVHRDRIWAEQRIRMYLETSE